MCRARSVLVPVAVTVVVLSGSAQALPTGPSSAYHVSIDVSGLGGQAIQLEVDLFDNSGVLHDSAAWLDNVTLRNAGSLIDRSNFDDGTLQGFDKSLNPASVSVESAAMISGASSLALRVDEDNLVTPTITFRNFAANPVTLLEFDLGVNLSPTPGFFGLDELVVSLLKPTLEPLVPGLTGSGDVLSMSASGYHASAGVTVEGLQPVIPEPLTLLASLTALIGLGVKARKDWRRAE